MNVAGMIVAGIITLALQRALWTRYGKRVLAARDAALESQPLA